MTPKQRARRVISLYKKGMPQNEIAGAVDVLPCSVNVVLHTNNVAMRPFATRRLSAVMKGWLWAQGIRKCSICKVWKSEGERTNSTRCRLCNAKLSRAYIQKRYYSDPEWRAQYIKKANAARTRSRKKRRA